MPETVVVRCAVRFLIATYYNTRICRRNRTDAADLRAGSVPGAVSTSSAYKRPGARAGLATGAGIPPWTF
jgi:hypothetical protein